MTTDTISPRQLRAKVQKKSLLFMTIDTISPRQLRAKVLKKEFVIYDYRLLSDHFCTIMVAR